MNQQIRDMMFNADGRYLTEAEEALLRGYGEGLLARADVVSAIERAEGAIIETAVKAIHRAYPKLADDYGPNVDATIRRDLVLSLRYAAQGMLAHDLDFVRDKLAVWLRTILLSMNEQARIVFGYEQLSLACREHLAPSDSATLAPYLDVIIRELKSGRKNQT